MMSYLKHKKGDFFLFQLMLAKLFTKKRGLVYTIEYVIATIIW